MEVLFGMCARGGDVGGAVMGLPLFGSRGVAHRKCLMVLEHMVEVVGGGAAKEGGARVVEGELLGSVFLFCKRIEIALVKAPEGEEGWGGHGGHMVSPRRVKKREGGWFRGKDDEFDESDESDEEMGGGEYSGVHEGGETASGLVVALVSEMIAAGSVEMALAVKSKLWDDEEFGEDVRRMVGYGDGGEIDGKLVALMESL